MKARPMTKTRLPQLLALGAAAMLAGCSMIPKYERPAAPVAAEWPATTNWVAGSAQAPAAAAPATTAAPAAADIEWQAFSATPSFAC